MCVNYFQAKKISKFTMLPMKWKKTSCLYSLVINFKTYIKHWHFYEIDVLCRDFAFSKISLMLHIFAKIFRKFYCFNSKISIRKFHVLPIILRMNFSCELRFFYVHVTRKSCQNSTFVWKICTFNIDEIASRSLHVQHHLNDPLFLQI
jgi:hypothetical protein